MIDTRTLHRRHPVERVLAAALTLAFSAGANATTLTVNSLADGVVPADGQVTLREALLAAATGATTDLGQTASGDDRVDLTGVSGQIRLASALPAVATHLQIDGPGSALLSIVGSQGNGAADDGILLVQGVLRISNVTLAQGTSRGGNGGSVPRDGAGGGAAGMGGAVLVDGTGRFTASGVVFTGNVAMGGNGGNTDGPLGYFYSGGGGGFGEDAASLAGAPVNGARGTRGGDGGALGGTGGAPGTYGSYGHAGSGGDGGGGGGGGTGIATDGGRGGFAGGGGGAGFAHCGAGPAGAGGFGGGGGGGTLCNTDGYVKAVGGAGGDFAGKGGDGSGTDMVNSGTGGGGGGGAGLGGALFVRAGAMARVVDCRFNGNSAVRGSGGSGGSNGKAGADGQGKAGAIFAMHDSLVVLSTTQFDGNMASDAGTAIDDNADLHGSIVSDDLFRADFDADGF